MKFDFRSLIGGRQCLLPIELGRNGSFIKTQAHIDGGANIFGAISTSLSYRLAKAFGIKFLSLPKPIFPTGYNGQPGAPIEYALLLTLTIDHRRINFPFLVTELGGTDILIGRKFMKHYDIKQDYKQNRLDWPADMPVIPYFDKRIFLDLNTKPVQRQAHQTDAARRDALMDQEISTPTPMLANINRRAEPKGRLSSFARDLKKNLARMENCLTAALGKVPQPAGVTPKTKSKTAASAALYTVNIALISAAAC